MIGIPAPGPDVLRLLVREVQDAERAAQAAIVTRDTTRDRAVAVESTIRAALGVPEDAILDITRGVFVAPS